MTISQAFAYGVLELDYVSMYRYILLILIFAIPGCWRDSTPVSGPKPANGPSPAPGAVAVKMDSGPRYAEPNSCFECHEKETEEWRRSDHSHAMGLANEKNVLGNFNDIEFIHVGFDDILELSDADLTAVFKVVFDPHEIALALEGAKSGVAEKIKSVLDENQKEALRLEVEHRKKIGFTRPGDIAVVNRKYADAIRKHATDLDFGAKTRFFMQDAKFMVTTDNREGKEETFEIKYTLGIRPLQQYMVEFPDGRVQCLPVAWDVKGKSWFHLYPNEQIKHDDPLHWTGFYQNWNSNCADCHTTDLRKNYDLGSNTFKTEWTEMGLGCQSCHGPSQEHVDLARKHALSDKWKDGVPMGLYRWTEASEELKLDSCSACHARRRTLTNGPMEPGKPFLDYFMPDLIEAPHYYPDGQILEEVFEYTSFQQAKMYHRGVQCGHCHDPHSIEPKFEGNRLCQQCHSPLIYDTVSHHFHPDSSQPGTKCIDCHLPIAHYMVVDPRRDHSITKPRPELTVELGVPNACNICHDDREKGEDAAWALDWVEKWYGEKRQTAVGYTKNNRTATHFAFALDGGNKNDPEAFDSLISTSKIKDGLELRPIARASLIAALGRYPFPETLPVCEDALLDPNGLVRWAGIMAIEHKLDPGQKKEKLTRFLDDPLRAVRCETARILASVPLEMWSEKELRSLKIATGEYVNALETVGESAVSHLNLAILRYEQAVARLAVTEIGPAEIRAATLPAVEEYVKAVELDPKFIPARVNLAMLYAERGEPGLAEREFRYVIEINPELGEMHYSLGLLLAERNRLDEAIKSLEKAAELLPDGHRVHFNLSTALRKKGDIEAAEKAMRRYEER